jgi:PAS domain S-box-containing protein
VPAFPGLLESIVEHLPAMVFLKDAVELRFVLFNRAGEELLGFDRRNLCGKNDYDFFPKEQADSFTAKDRQVIAGGRAVSLEEPITTARGERWLLTHKVPILGDAGEPKYLLGISIDITERRAYEETLDANSRLREALSTLLALEGVAAAGSLAGRVAAQIERVLADGASERTERDVRSLAGSLAKLGVTGASGCDKAPSVFVVDDALALWVASAEVRALVQPCFEPSSEPAPVARATPEALEKALTSLLAFVARRLRSAGTPVLVRGAVTHGAPEVHLVVPSLELGARTRAELPRIEPEAALAAMLLARSDGALSIEPAGPGTRFRCRLCPSELVVVVSVEQLIALMSSADPDDARRAIERAAELLRVAPPFKPEVALRMLDLVTAEGGSLGVIACFAKARAILDFTGHVKRRR